MKKCTVIIISTLMGTLGGIIVIGRHFQKKISKIQDLSDKHLALFLMMNQWLKIRQEGKRLESYFKRNNYRRIAIYGMSYVGETLLEELKETEVQVIYAIDKNMRNIPTDIDLVSTEDSFGDVDAIVVTAITFFDEINDLLRNKVNCPIISLEDILYEV